MFKLFFIMVMTVAIFCMGFGFGSVFSPVPNPQECKVIDFASYDPTVNEDPAIKWGWEK